MTETDEQAVWRIRKECELLQGEHFLENIDDLFEEYARRLLAWERGRGEPVAWMVESSFNGDEIQRNLHEDYEGARADKAANGGVIVPLKRGE